VNKGDPASSPKGGVGSDKPTKRGWPDGLSEVGLADSTRRQGEPVTWGSGQRDLSSSKET
jgi:hypothetical protein